MPRELPSEGTGPETNPVRSIRQLWVVSMYLLHMANPQSLVDLALRRMDETGNHYLAALLNEDNIRLFATKPLRFAQMEKESAATRQGASLAFLYYDFAAEMNGQPVPIVNAQSQEAADVAVRGLNMQYDLAQENLPPDQSRIVQDKILLNHIWQIPRSLLTCSLAITADSALYAERTDSRNAFILGLFQTHLLFDTPRR